ncbi:MAG TPA: hypothetical protein VLZ10_11890, partial [Thermodesulfobacteriota bacterium]|nr:hypothetical protein [Thermodesulfobacteriota bacterium]
MPKTWTKLADSALHKEVNDRKITGLAEFNRPDPILGLMGSAKCVMVTSSSSKEVVNTFIGNGLLKLSWLWCYFNPFPFSPNLFCSTSLYAQLTLYR